MQAGKKLFFKPDEYFDNLIQDINQAQFEIILETYIFKLDSIGNRVLSALNDADARGVSLKLLIDGVGSYRDASQIAASPWSGNSEVRVFHPLPWDFAVYRRALKAERWYSQAFYFIASMNHRDHRKLCLIDAKIAWLGSYNITADHANLSSLAADDYWHDTGLRVTGSIVQQLTTNFNHVWQRKTGSISQRSRHFMARDEIRRRRQPRLHLLQELGLCHQRIWITNAYFNPSRQILKVLKSKAESGISVLLIVPKRSDSVFFPLVSRSFYTDLLRSNIRVFEYSNRVLHSKTILIDEQVLIGSTNLNYRSLFHDLELDLLLDNAQLVEQMQERFCNDIENSVEITLRQWQRHPWLLRFMGWLSRFMRYWM